jgi:2-iminobutanoate/2-iminopropanoate deaminase
MIRAQARRKRSSGGGDVNRAGENPFEWAAGYDFSQSVVAEGRFVFTAGQGGFGADGAVVDPESCEAQLRQAFANLAAVLEAAGASLESVVKTTVCLLRAEDYDAFTRVRREVFSPPFPASTAILAGGFLFPGMLVELEAVAVVGERRV